MRILGSKLNRFSKSLLVLGPRQVGKSTLMRGLKPDLTINLARESEYQKFTSQPGYLEEVVEASSAKTIFIDEVQRIPALLNSVQALIDESGGRRRFFLSGSSARKLRRGHANLLPGRILVYRLGGLCGSEIPLGVKSEHLLRFGLLPEPALNSDEDFCAGLLESYAGTYLREEIQAESLVQNLSGFSRFLSEAGGAAGQILDYSKIAKRVRIPRSTCVRFFEILQDTLMVDRCEVFEGVPGADIIKHPKFFFFDVGVRNALTGHFDFSPERRGAVFEHFIFNQISNSLMAANEKGKIEFFRTRSGLEVDFVVTLKKKIWAIDVKVGAVDESDLKPLRAFSDLAGNSVQLMAVSLKEPRPRNSKGVLICDWRTMLEELGF